MVTEQEKLEILENSFFDCREACRVIDSRFHWRNGFIVPKRKWIGGVGYTDLENAAITYLCKQWNFQLAGRHENHD